MGASDAQKQGREEAVPAFWPGGGPGEQHRQHPLAAAARAAGPVAASASVPEVWGLPAMASTVLWGQPWCPGLFALAPAAESSSVRVLFLAVQQ